MRFIQRLACVALACASPLGVAAPPKTVVWGTGNPSVDVAAVQAAVDRGGQVILQGHFSFEQPPTVPNATSGFPQATVRISSAVSITGFDQDDTSPADITGGTIPFYVEAPGAHVEIRALRLIRPRFEAILVKAVDGLVIEGCRIEGVEVINTIGTVAIDINSILVGAATPTPAAPGDPGKITGHISVVDNEIDVSGGTERDRTLGILVFSAGLSPGKAAEVHIAGNFIRNHTEPAINVRRIGGRVRIEENVITTGKVTSRDNPRLEVIRAVNIGTYVVANNTIIAEWDHPNVAGIGLFSQFREWPVQKALVVGNDVTLLPPAGTAYGDLAAGIAIRGFASDNLVVGNTVRGRSRAAFSVDRFNGGTPADTTFVLDRASDFTAGRADFYIDSGITGTRLVANSGSVEDHGVGTTVKPR